MQNSHFFQDREESSEKCHFCDKLLWTTPDLESTFKEKLEKYCFRSFIDKYECQKQTNKKTLNISLHADNET